VSVPRSAWAGSNRNIDWPGGYSLVACRSTKNVLAGISFAALLVVLPGCNPAAPLERAGIELAPPASWHRERPSTWMVPGTPLAAWSGPDGSSFVIYRTLWVPGGSAEMFAEALGNRLDNLPGLKLVVKRAETAAGAQAARVEVIAPGTGDALASSGLGEPNTPPGKTLSPTREVTLAFARPDHTIYLTWHVPQRSYDRIEPDIRATIQSLRFDSRPAAGSRK
jgi:hypothetical protein